MTLNRVKMQKALGTSSPFLSSPASWQLQRSLPQPRLSEQGTQTAGGSGERTNNTASGRERLHKYLHSWGETEELSKAILG